MAKETPKKLPGVSVRVPSHVRSRLLPYARVFEDVVVPIALRTRGAGTPPSVKVELRESVESAFVAATGFVPHPWLMRCGLMLCCYHAIQQQGNRNRPVLTKTYQVLRDSFDHYSTEDAQVLL
jgi:hypothetical protein